MSHYFDKAKQRWRFSFNRIIEGERIRATKLLPRGWSRAQAEKYDHEETARLYAVATGVAKPEPLIGDAVALFIKHRARNLRNGRKVIQDLAFLFEYIDGRPLSHLADVCREYIDEHPELADGTLHNRLAYLKSACRYAWKRHKLTDHDPTGQMEIPRPDNARDVQLPLARIDALLAKIDDAATRALYTLAFRTGTRWRSGIHPRSPEDIERHGRDVWIRIGITKSGKPRMKWVPPDVRWTLEHLPFEFNPEYYYRRFCLARAAVALASTWAHDMRHVVATDIRKRGGSLEDVGAALDHESYASSARYAHITPHQVKRVLAGIPPARKVHTGARRRRLKKAA